MFADACSSPRTQGYLAAHFPLDPADPHRWEDPCLYGTVAALYVVAYHVTESARACSYILSKQVQKSGS